MSEALLEIEQAQMSSKTEEEKEQDDDNNVEDNVAEDKAIDVDKDLEEEFKEKENAIDSIINSAFQSMLDDTVATVSPASMDSFDSDLPLPPPSSFTEDYDTQAPSNSSPVKQQSIDTATTTTSSEPDTSTPSTPVAESVPTMRSIGTRPRTKDEAKATISALLSERMRSEGYGREGHEDGGGHHQQHKQPGHVHQDMTGHMEIDPATLQSSLMQFGLALVVFFILKYFFGL